MRVDIFRKIFLCRVYRLAFFLGVSFILNLILATLFPAWMIVLGPLVLGIPHLFSGFRFLPKLIGSHQTHHGPVVRFINIPWDIFACVFLGLLPGVIRFFVDVLQPKTGFIGIELEMAVLAIFFLAMSSLGRFSIKKIALFILIVLPLLMGFLKAPLLTFGLVATGHNLMAFYFWFVSTQVKKEKVLVFIALVGLGIVSFLFWTDLFQNQLPVLSSPEGWLLQPEILIQNIFPPSLSPKDTYSMLRWFAFCQGMHYFVWLKAIPEQMIDRQVPLTFKRSWTNIQADLGAPLTQIVMLVCIGFIVSISLFDLVSLKNSYFMIASAHGYLEIAAVPLIGGRK